MISILLLIAVLGTLVEMDMNDLIARLNQIFESLLGCRISFASVEELSNGEWDFSDLALLQDGDRNAPTYVKDVEGRRLGFAVRIGERFAGLAVVSDWSAADSRRLFDLAELATSLLERNLSGVNDKAEILRRTEEHFAVEYGAANVIPLRPTRAAQSTHLFPIAPPPKISMPSLLIQVKKGFPLQRFAFELHSRAERWAFVSSADLPADAFESRETLKSLGAITLFIENVASLSLDRQAQLAAYLRSMPTEDSPLIVAVVDEEPELLEERGLLHEGLRALLAHARIPWNPQDNDNATVKRSIRLLIDGGAQATAETRFVPFHEKYLDEDQPIVH